MSFEKVEAAWAAYNEAMKRWVKFEDWSPDQNLSFEGERRDGQMAAAGNDA